MRLYTAYDSTVWKLSVTVVGFVIKVGGNKSLLGLVANARPWMADLFLFIYEFTTALMLRLMQMSLPDEDTAVQIGLASAMGEVCVRIFFFAAFAKGGLRQRSLGNEMTDKDWYDYARWGKTRVQDGTNDEIVEYLSTITAGLFLIFLAPTDAFSFATSVAIKPNTVLLLCLYQLVPELFLDFFVTFIETSNGLKTLHESYWNPSTGGDPNARAWIDRKGDLFKGIAAKLASVVLFTAFILLVARI